MTTLITGAFGCIGAWVIRGLLAADEPPVMFDLGADPWRVCMIAGPDTPERLTLVRGDITDRAQIGRVVRDHGVRRITHLAAWQVPLCRQDPPRGASINVTGRWGGSTDLIYTEDVARALLTAAAVRPDGARVYNLHGA